VFYRSNLLGNTDIRVFLRVRLDVLVKMAADGCGVFEGRKILARDVGVVVQRTVAAVFAAKANRQRVGFGVVADGGDLRGIDRIQRDWRNVDLFSALRQRGLRAVAVVDDRIIG